MTSTTTDTSATTLAAVIAMLEQRERTAQAAYDEIRDRLRDNDRAAVPAMSHEERKEERHELRCASARWTEAQEALAVARGLVRRATP